MVAPRAYSAFGAHVNLDVVRVRGIYKPTAGKLTLQRWSPRSTPGPPPAVAASVPDGVDNEARTRLNRFLDEPEASPLYLDLRTQRNQDRSASRRRTALKESITHLGGSLLLTRTTRIDQNFYTAQAFHLADKVCRQRFVRNHDYPFPAYVTVLEAHRSSMTSAAKLGSIHGHTVLGRVEDVDQFLNDVKCCWPHGSQVDLTAGRSSESAYQTGERFGRYLAPYLSGKREATALMIAADPSRKTRIMTRSRSAIPPAFPVEGMTAAELIAHLGVPASAVVWDSTPDDDIPQTRIITWDPSSVVA